MRDRRLAVLRRWRDNTPDPDEIEYMRWVEELAASRGEELPPDEPLQVPFPLWPEPGGIFPWAQGASVPVFFWLRAGQDPRSWPVVWFHGDDPDPLMWEQFDGTATDFLIALVTGQIDVQRLGAPAFPPPPRFDQWVEGQSVPKAGWRPPPSQEEIDQMVRNAFKDLLE